MCCANVDAKARVDFAWLGVAKSMGLEQAHAECGPFATASGC